MVDILKGAHYQEPYASLNPNRLVPMLEDGDLRLTESSAILNQHHLVFDCVAAIARCIWMTWLWPSLTGEN